MNALVPDFPAYVEQTEPIRQKQLLPLAFDAGDDGLEWVVRDVIEELEFLIDLRAIMAPEDFREEVRTQARRLLK
ncbi:hypothetical protein ABEO98_22585 [Brevibacillus parabrevis]|jgi:hypothetical protein|uniref:hypothetical protein n=1 Tax=Brevibacillus parabrevis TaxID=54914 RepID=UPI0024937062|nr:hypothetical protein [Brevibacillus parabrevis]